MLKSALIASILLSPVAVRAADVPPAPPHDAQAPQHQQDPMQDKFIPPDLILHNAEALGLTEDQAHQVKEQVHQVELRFPELQKDLQHEMEAFRELIGTDRPDEQKVLAQLDKVLKAEGEIKKLHLRLALAVRNTLTLEQQAKARAIRAKMMADAQQDGHGPDGPPESFRVKMNRVEERARQIKENGGDPSRFLGPMMEQVQPLLHERKFKEAEAVLDRVLKETGANEAGQPK